MADAAELNALLKGAASKLPNLRQLSGLQSCEGSVFENKLASVGMSGGTCISTDSVWSKIPDCCINLYQQLHSCPR
jgi:hypothetical protein